MPVCNIYRITSRISNRTHQKISCILLQFILELLRCSRYHMPWFIADIGTIKYPPVTITGHLAPDTPDGICNHERRCSSICKVQDTDSLLVSVDAYGNCCTNKASVKGKSTW